MSTGFDVDPGALAVTAEGVQGVVDELGQLGMDGEQASGSPVTNLALSADDCGSSVMSAGLADVLDRAHYVLRDLVGNAEQLVTRLRTSRTRYQQVESTVAGKFEGLSEALLGAPSTSGPTGGAS
jgi:excreted virulence factor EspC (type VII ESX diderm)